MEQVLDPTQQIKNVDKIALKFTNINKEGVHDLSFMSKELFRLLTTGDIMSSCNLSVIVQLVQLILDNPPQQKSLEKLKVLLETAFTMMIKEASDDLNNFVSDPESNLNLFSLYNKIIGTDPLNINVLKLDHTTSKFINKMFAIKYPSYVIKNKRNFNVDDISEFTRLFTVLEEKYFDGTINYEIPVFGIHENIFFNDYPKDIDTNLSIKINNINKNNIIIDDTHIVERFNSDEVITELIGKYDDNITFSGIKLLTYIINSGIAYCNFDEYLKYFSLDSLDIVHSGNLRQRNDMIDTIIELEKNKYSCKKNYKIDRNITVQIETMKKYRDDDLIDLLKIHYKLEENVTFKITHTKINNGNESVLEDGIKYYISNDKTRLEFGYPSGRIYEIYSYSELDDYYKNEGSIRIFMKKWNIYAYPSAMHLLINKNFDKQSISGDISAKTIDKDIETIIELINKGFIYNCSSLEEKEYIQNMIRDNNKYIELEQ